MGDEQKYVVKSLMAIVNLDNGTAVHLQHGAPIPSNVDPDHLQHLLDNELATATEFVGGLEPVYTGDLSEQLTSPGTDSDPDAGSDAPPAKSATKDVWVDYAVSQGATQEDAEASTKDDLIAAYGGS